MSCHLREKIWPCLLLNGCVQFLLLCPNPTLKSHFRTTVVCIDLSDSLLANRGKNSVCDQIASLYLLCNLVLSPKAEFVLLHLYLEQEVLREGQDTLDKYECLVRRYKCLHRTRKTF